MVSSTNAVGSMPSMQPMQSLQATQHVDPVVGKATQTQEAGAVQKVVDAAAASFLLLLHVDVNKTIVAIDSAKGRLEYAPIFNIFLAEEYSYLWEESLPHPMPYRTYVEKHKKIDAQHEKDLNQKRKYLREHFVDFLIETDHPLRLVVEAEYKSMMKKMEDRFVFPSFISLIKKLRNDKINVRIILRTFGTDGAKAAEDIQTQLPEERFTTHGHFEDSKLHLQHKTMSAIGEIYDYFSSNECGHIVLRDKFEEWEANTKLQDFGKKFPVNIYDPRVLSLFFDDNVESAPNSKTNIVAPIDATSGASIPVSMLLDKKVVVAAKPVQAIKDDSYFIDHVDAAISMHKTMATTKLVVTEHLNLQPPVDCVLSYL